MLKHSCRIAPCLWFNDQAEDAAEFYVSVFRNSRIVSQALYGEAGQEFHGKPPGSVMTVSFELEGQSFTALNGGPQFKFSEAISLQVNCESQDEIDYYWERLSYGGDPSSQQCGWLKDQFGLSWQIVPAVIDEMMCDTDSAKTDRTMSAILQMKKIDLATLQTAYAG